MNNQQTVLNLGQIVVTKGVTNLIKGEVAVLFPFIKRHSMGDWGEVCETDNAINNEALTSGERIISSYRLKEKKIWVITEADRSVTTILLPEEY